MDDPEIPVYVHVIQVTPEEVDTLLDLLKGGVGLPHEDHFHIPTMKCLKCGTVIDCASETHGRDTRPSKGAFAVCETCLHLMAFTGDESNGLRELTDDETREVMADSRVQDYLRTARARLGLV